MGDKTQRTKKKTCHDRIPTSRVNFVKRQNIDGLHLKMSLPKSRVVLLHGSELELYCMQCGAQHDRFEIHQKVKCGPLNNILILKRCEAILSAILSEFLSCQIKK